MTKLRRPEEILFNHLPLVEETARKAIEEIAKQLEARFSGSSIDVIMGIESEKIRKAWGYIESGLNLKGWGIRFAREYEEPEVITRVVIYPLDMENDVRER